MKTDITLVDVATKRSELDEAGRTRTQVRPNRVDANTEDDVTIVSLRGAFVDVCTKLHVYSENQNNHVFEFVSSTNLDICRNVQKSLLHTHKRSRLLCLRIARKHRTNSCCFCTKNDVIRPLKSLFKTS